MTIHLRQKRGQGNKSKFVCLENAYHGETLATMSVSDCGIYLDPYRNFMFDSLVLDDIPYVSGKTDPLWDNAELYWLRTENILNKNKDILNCLIVEPICQGAAGMKLYSKDYLNRLCKWCKSNDVYVIFDEIMTGAGRLGKMFAYEYIDCRPDFLCISKGITSGVIPFSVVLTVNEYYSMFYSDNLLDAFLHSHTHSGNVLGASCANSVLDVFENENVIDNVNNLEKLLYESMVRIQYKTSILKNIRCIGAVVAADIDIYDSNMVKDICQRALNYGVLMRPLGQTIYCLPPLNSSEDDICHWEDGVLNAIIDNI
jgi:adenosylmethionine-8-amino-7-oxononanoate aminotransferase